MTHGKGILARVYYAGDVFIVIFIIKLGMSFILRDWNRE